MSKQSKRAIKGQDASEGNSFLSATPITGSANSNATSEATPSVSMTEALLKSISAAVAEEGKRILLSVNESFGKLEAKVDNMMKRIDDIAVTTAALATRQAEAETRISHLEDGIAPIKKHLDSLLITNKELRDKVIELECRQRRKNIRILNLKESTEGNDPTVFFEAFIPKLLQLPVTTIPIDRAHRGFGIPEDGRPRAVVLKLQRSRDVAMVMSAVKRQGNPQHEGRTLRLVPDTPPEVRAARRAFNTVCAELIKLDIRFRMAYPAILSFKANGGQKSFKDPNKAEAFLSSLT
ncbi:unnamed protein product [Knipowitschia caucasica]|uniref:Uncharacterized protein n=1 Tax=Knipowitschia caucasica TaxID=637954 RepID=A0AAV2MHB7_KNICA